MVVKFEEIQKPRALFWIWNLGFSVSPQNFCGVQRVEGIHTVKILVFLPPAYWYFDWYFLFISYYDYDWILCPFQRSKNPSCCESPPAIRSVSGAEKKTPRKDSPEQDGGIMRNELFQIPSGHLTVCYWKLPFIVDLYGFIHWKLWFSIAHVTNYQRVPLFQTEDLARRKKKRRIPCNMNKS